MNSSSLSLPFITLAKLILSLTFSKEHTVRFAPFEIVQTLNNGQARRLLLLFTQQSLVLSGRPTGLQSSLRKFSLNMESLC